MVTGTDTRRASASGRLALVAAAVGVAAVGLVSAPSAQTFGLTDYSGEELFGRFCAACHGPGGEGDGPVAATMSVSVPDLTRLAERSGGEFPAAEVRDVIDGRALVIAHGPRSMPVWGYEFWVDEGGDIEAEAHTRELIDRLVTHIESIQRRGQRERIVP